MDGFSQQLILPALILSAAGWLAPRGLAMVFPEGVRPLIWIAAIATAMMLALSTAFFVALYLREGAPLGALFANGVGAGLWHFLRLGLMSALVWGPVLALTVASLPGHWEHETW